MAKGKIRYRTRYAKARRTYRKARGFGKGGVIGNIVDGVLVGAVQGVIPNDFLMGYGDALVPIGVGWFRKNSTLQTIGGYQLGLKIAQSMQQGGASPGFKGQ